MQDGHILHKALQKAVNRLRVHYHEHVITPNQKQARKFLTNASVVEAIKNEIFMNTTSFEARLISASNNILRFRRTDNTSDELICITEKVFYHDCLFPEELCNSEGKIKQGSVVRLFQTATGKIYPDKNHYKLKVKTLLNSNVEENKYALQFIPRLPYYRKAIVTLLLDRQDELGREVVENYLDGLVRAKDEMLKNIYQDLRVPLFDPEGLCTEYKSSIKTSADPSKNQNRVLANSISAMYNSKAGGQIICGVSDDRTVTGLNNEVDVSRLNETEGQLRNTFTQLLGDTNAVAKLEFQWFRDWNDKLILVISVPNDYQTPVLVAGTFVYLRIGSNTQLLKGTDMLNFLMEQHKKVS